MKWEVELTDECLEWWQSLDAGERRSVGTAIDMLETAGPTLPHPHTSGVKQSRHAHMRELRIQHQGHPYRVLYAFDPRRAAILLIGGDKTGNNRWYEVNVPKADTIYDEHLNTLKQEGLIR